MKASRGFRHGTRNKLKKGIREKFKPEDYLKAFNKGDNVAIRLNSTSQKGMPHPKFNGMTGKVVGRRGDAYLVEFKDGNKAKTVIARPEHLKGLQANISKRSN